MKLNSDLPDAEGAEVSQKKLRKEHKVFLNFLGFFCVTSAPSASGLPEFKSHSTAKP